MVVILLFIVMLCVLSRQISVIHSSSDGMEVKKKFSFREKNQLVKTFHVSKPVGQPKFDRMVNLIIPINFLVDLNSQVS